jgi:hypothetical protein
LGPNINKRLFKLDQLGKKMIEQFLSFLPAYLAPYSSIITIILLFADGALFGLAAKKALTSLILIVVGIILAGVVGLSAPLGLSTSEIFSKILNILYFQAAHGATAIVYTFPVFWIIGFGIGLWKG